MPSRTRTIVKTKRFALTTVYVGDQIDFKKFQEGVKKYKYLNRDHPLVLELLEEEYAVVTKFGAVVFWNVRKNLVETFLKEITPFVKSVHPANHHNDTLVVHVSREQERVTFDEVFVRALDIEKIKVISYVSAQSVALDRYEEEIDGRLNELGKVVENLKISGRTKFNQKELLRQVGNVLSVKQNTVSSLSLFDKPEEAWEREEIEKLYDHLRAAYDLHDRFDILNEKIDFLSENNTTIVNFIEAQRSNSLEIVIIILIVFEIILFLIDVFLR